MNLNRISQTRGLHDLVIGYVVVKIKATVWLLSEFNVAFYPSCDQTRFGMAHFDILSPPDSEFILG